MTISISSLAAAVSTLLIEPLRRRERRRIC